jgi:hypothetical protein
MELRNNRCVDEQQNWALDSIFKGRYSRSAAVAFVGYFPVQLHLFVLTPSILFFMSRSPVRRSGPVPGRSDFVTAMGSSAADDLI